VKSPDWIFEFPATTIVELVVGARSSSQLRNEIEGLIKSEPQYSRVQPKAALLDEAAGRVRIR